MNDMDDKVMASCIVPDCRREPQDPKAQSPICFYHKIRTVSFDYSVMGHLRNRMYPGLTNKETKDRIYALAAERGEEIRPVDSSCWT
jgi:hypothetical protein